MVAKRSVLCLFWWAQLSQTASTDCQALKIAAYFSQIAPWAYSQKVIKITSSLLSKLGVVVAGKWISVQAINNEAHAPAVAIEKVSWKNSD